MDILQQVILLTLTPTLIVAGVTFILRKFFEQGLARDIESFKAKCTLELEQSKSLLQTQIFEFQTKFSSYHQKQTEVISELFSLLNEAEWAVSALVHPMQPAAYANTIRERVPEVDQKVVELSRFFSKHRIYLSSGVCDKLETVIRTLRHALIKFDTSHINMTGQPSLDMWLEAWKMIETDLLPLKTELEAQFRLLLSSTSPVVSLERST